MKNYKIYLLLTMLSLLVISCGDKSKKVLSNEIQLPITDTNWVKVTGNLDFPEGPAWDVSSKSIFLSNCYGGWISKVNNSVHDTFLVASKEKLSFEKTNGLTFHNGYLYACEYGNGEILKISQEGKIEIYADSYNGEKFNRP
ncbi:MAG: hypothetical protein GY936_06000, partial [Ignavibacteriae bacterium]|nr:hypothetical protein [Ignavibacteriota bacterium]